MFQVKRARYINPKNLMHEKFFCSMMNNGMNAMNTATVILIMGHARKNNKPDRSESRMGWNFFKQMVFVKIGEMLKAIENVL
jgi:hypothetical protein